MTTTHTPDSWVRLLDTVSPCIDSETVYGPTQGVGTISEDAGHALYIRWNAGLLSGSNYSWRKPSELHVMTDAERQAHQDWIDAP